VGGTMKKWITLIIIYLASSFTAIAQQNITQPDSARQDSAQKDMAQQENESSQAFNQLLEDIWQYEVSQFPYLARSEGKEPQTPLTDISLAAIAF